MKSAAGTAVWSADQVPHELGAAAPHAPEHRCYHNLQGELLPTFPPAAGEVAHASPVTANTVPDKQQHQPLDDNPHCAGANHAAVVGNRVWAGSVCALK